MVIFHSYVSLPEGKPTNIAENQASAPAALQDVEDSRASRRDLQEKAGRDLRVFVSAPKPGIRRRKQRLLHIQKVVIGHEKYEKW
jgi:hypothetical protein